MGFRPIGALWKEILLFSKNPTFLISLEIDLRSMDVEEPWYMSGVSARLLWWVVAVGLAVIGVDGSRGGGGG